MLVNIIKEQLPLFSHSKLGQENLGFMIQYDKELLFTLKNIYNLFYKTFLGCFKQEVKHSLLLYFF